ncbi:MAG: type II toxin-antitoxin system PrlF family antitoxin [Cyanobacteriota bacterium]|nr:type II toxin-antitoxin system PrlF family antitoxin [Cyanobacteriota bacterium]
MIMSNFQQQEEDFVLKKILNFLAQDMKNNPQHIKPISPDLIKRIQFVTDGIEVNLDAPLSEEDE